MRGAPAERSEGGFTAEVPVVIAASASWDTPAPVNVHQVARRLAARGHRVLFVESTGLRAPSAASRHDLARVLARLRGFGAGARRVAPGIDVIAPLALPGGGPLWLRRASLRLLAFQVARSARRLGLARPVLWGFLPTALELPAALDARAFVYHCVDHYAANPGVDRAWIERLEQRVLERADLVLATSPVLAERLRAAGADPVLVPNVADVGLFSRALAAPDVDPPALVNVPRPRLVYVGNLAAYRVDFDLLRALARARRDASVVLIGPRGFGDTTGASPAEHALLGEPNVYALGTQPHTALPTLLARMDVALIPFLDNEHTRGSLPLKLWEYLAAGLPVVATPLPSMADAVEQRLVRTAASPDAFVEACAAALAEPSERRAERSRAARAHDWPARMEQLCALVDQAVRRRERATLLGQ